MSPNSSTTFLYFLLLCFGLAAIPNASASEKTTRAKRMPHSDAGNSVKSSPAIPTSVAPHAPTHPARTPALSETLTVEEYVKAATRALAAGNWGEAADAIQALSLHYAARPEAAPLITRLQPPLALCLVRLERYEDALGPIERALHSNSPGAVSLKPDLLFQKALCQLKTHRPTEARETFASFLSIEPAGQRAQEALLLVAKCFLLEGNSSKAADALSNTRSQFDPEHARQSAVLELRARIEADQTHLALSLIRSESDRLQSSPDLITVNGLLLRLGSRLVEQDRFREAIACLTQVRAFTPLIQTQREKLRAIEKQIVSLNGRSDPKIRSSLTQAADQLQLEIESFKDYADYDALARLRMAEAYQALSRPREAATIIEHAVTHLPQNPMLEEASVTLAQLWLQLECWSKVEETSTLFAALYPNSQRSGTVQLLKGIAQQKDGRFKDALSTFEAVQKQHPGKDWGKKAEFMAAFTRLQAGEPETAARLLQNFEAGNPSHPLSEEAAHWLCVAHSIRKRHDLCIEAAERYLKKHPNGSNRPAVLFQQARATFNLHNYPQATVQLTAFIDAFPDNPRLGEALLLRAEAYEAAEKYEDALRSALAVPPTDGPSYEEAWFKAAKLLKTTGCLEQLPAHLEQFAAYRPGSPAFANALLFTLNSVPNPAEQADARIWDILNRYGNDPSNHSVEPLLLSLQKFAREAPPSALIERLQREIENADGTGQTVWSVRLRWALLKILQGTNPDKAAAHLLETTAQVDPEITSARILADLASAVASHEKDPNGEPSLRLWRELLKWHPASPLRDQALSALILHSFGHQNTRETIRLIELFESECLESPLAGRILLIKAKLSGNEAANTLESILSQPNISGEFKAAALLELGEIQMRHNRPKLAIPYFQRIYVMYGRWKQTVAAAYLRSGEAFEQIGDKEAARKTYQEMLALKLPLKPGETQKAEQRLSVLSSGQ